MNLVGCGSCCTSMSTTNANPSVCQLPCCACGDGGSSNVQSWLNTIGKLGVTIGGVVSGRPVAMTKKGVQVGASSSYRAAVSQSYMPLLIIAAVAILAFALLSHRG